jgi:hypothetical protein
LTVRDPDQWFESFSKTIAPFIANRGKHPDRNDNIRADMMYRMVFGPLFDGRFDKKEVAISVYTRHIEMVQKTVPENRLLTYDVSDGWDQLCEFLQVPRPANTFPMTNTTRDFNNKK